MFNSQAIDDALDKVFESHNVIAFDMDGTLYVGDNDKLFCSYIRRHPEKTYHIVTFRDDVWAARIPAELAGQVPVELIAGIHACPMHLWDAHTASVDMTDPTVIEYTEWKGKKSAEVGATVLVDDLVSLVKPGCLKYGVQFVDANYPFRR